MTELAIEQCGPADYPAIFQLFGEGVSNWERRLQLDALRSALQRDEAGHFVILQARRDDQVVGWMVAHPQPGHVASVWGPGILPTEPETTGKKLHQQLCEALQSRGIRLLQVSLPLDDGAACATLLRLNFQPLACLAYLTLSFEMTPPPCSKSSWSKPPWPNDSISGTPPFEMVPCGPDDWRELEPVMAETYVGSLDCPQLNVVRSAKEVLEGYRAIAGFDPERWFRILEGGRVVGCLLLAAPVRDLSWELVYWGLVPSVRGRGWGEHVLRWAVSYARARGGHGLVLTVDESNHPAWTIYQRVGFKSSVRRQVLIQSI